MSCQPECWEPNMSLLQEQNEGELLTTEPSSALPSNKQ